MAKFMRNPWSKVGHPPLKRAFDFSLAACGLLLITPIIGLLVIVVRLDSAGPGIFVQERIGRFGRTFKCYKLRTMTTGIPNVPTHYLTTSQITRIGRFLRHTKLDELPQLWNVLKGDMSLVGPRPSLPSQLELIKERRRLDVLVLRPGITGLAQIRGIDMSDPRRLAETDAEYLHSCNFLLDLSLLFKSVFLASGRGDRISKL